MYYLGGASIALFAAGAGAVLYKFVQVSDSDVPFNNKPGVFPVDFELLNDSPPISFSEANAWLLNIDDGLIALDGRCTARRCLPKWVSFEDRFACPCCGSKFRLDGTRITGIAARDLDRFTLWAETPNGTLHTPKDGSSIPIANAISIWVDTTLIIPGPPRN